MPRKSSAKNSEPQIPDISDIYGEYAELNPEFDFPRMSERAWAEFQSLAYDEKGNELPPKKIIENILIFRERIKAKVPQLKENKPWNEKLAEVKKKRAEVFAQAEIKMTPEIEAIIYQKKGLLLAVAATPDEFEAALVSFEKRMQQRFTHPTEQMVFQRQTDEEGKWDMSHINYDPKYIDNTILEEMGLEKLKPKKGSRGLKRMTAYAKAIPELKSTMRDLRPMVIADDEDLAGIKDFRLMRIGEGKNRGYVLGTWRDDKDQLRFFRISLHGAYRRIKHIRDNYEKEFRALWELMGLIARIDRKVEQNWPNAKEELPKINAELCKWVKKLRFVRDKYKKNILRKIEKCLSIDNILQIPEQAIEERNGTRRVVRPARTCLSLKKGSLRTIWNSIRVDFRERKKAVEKKRPYLEKDQTKLLDFILEQQTPFKDLHKLIIQVEAPDEEAENDETVKGKGLHILRINDPLTAERRKKTMDSLKERRAQFNHFDKADGAMRWFEPYETFARKLVEHIDNTTAMLQKVETVQAPAPGTEKNVEQRTALAREFLNIYLVTKIEKFYERFQEEYEKHISMPEVPKFDEAIQAMDNLKQGLAQKNVRPELDTTAYYRVFSELNHLLNSVKKFCREAQEVTGTEEEKLKAVKKITDQMRKHVRNFRFDLLIKSNGAEYLDKKKAPKVKP